MGKPVCGNLGCRKDRYKGCPPSVPPTARRWLPCRPRPGQAGKAGGRGTVASTCKNAGRSIKLQYGRDE